MISREAQPASCWNENYANPSSKTTNRTDLGGLLDLTSMLGIFRSRPNGVPAQQKISTRLWSQGGTDGYDCRRLSPRMLARKEPNLCDFNALDMAGYRCSSGVRYRTRGLKEKVTCLTISFYGLGPEGCLVADPAKNDFILRWISISYWQEPFNGCFIESL